MIKSHKSRKQKTLNNTKIRNLQGLEKMGGNRGLRFKAKSFQDKHFVPEVFPDTYTLKVGRKQTYSKNAVSERTKENVNFKELNPDLAGLAVRGKLATSDVGTNFRENKILRYDPLADKKFAAADDSGKASGGDSGRSYVNEQKPLRAMAGLPTKIGRRVRLTKDLEKAIDVDYAEDKYRFDLDDGRKRRYEQLKIGIAK